MFHLLSKSKVLLILLLSSVVLFSVSVVLLLNVFPDIIQSEIFKHTSLLKHTDQFDRFVELPFPFLFKVYFFNVENPDEVLNGSKPVLKEVGPYVYQQYRKKTITNINEDEDTISYTQTEKFIFDPEASGNRSDDDFITILNAPMMGGLQAAEKIGQTKLLTSCISKIFPHLDTVFTKIKVKDVIFEGLKFCPEKLSLCVLQEEIFCRVAESKKNVDKLDDGSLKFSFFNYKRRSNDGLYRIKRGIKDPHTLGSIVSLNKNQYTHFWTKQGNKTVCDKIQGGDGTLFPPGITKSSVLQVHATDVCRSMKIFFKEETIYKGIKGYLFSTDNSTLRAYTSQREDDCFCANETQGVDGENNCFLDGVMDLQPCVGAPVLLSFPHFLWADSIYHNDIIGLSPNESLHKTYVTLEPNTGIPLEGIKRAQLNGVLRPIKNVPQTKNLPRVILPLVWVEEGVSLSDSYVQELKSMYFDKVKIVDIVQWSLLGVSSLLVVTFFSYFIYTHLH